MDTVKNQKIKVPYIAIGYILGITGFASGGIGFLLMMFFAGINFLSSFLFLIAVILLLLSIVLSTTGFFTMWNNRKTSSTKRKTWVIISSVLLALFSIYCLTQIFILTSIIKIPDQKPYPTSKTITLPL